MQERGKYACIHIFCFSFRKFWTRNRPGDRMRDRYNLNQLNGSEHELPEFGMYIFNPWNKKTGH